MRDNWWIRLPQALQHSKCMRRPMRSTHSCWHYRLHVETIKYPFQHASVERTLPVEVVQDQQKRWHFVTERLFLESVLEGKLLSVCMAVDSLHQWLGVLQLCNDATILSRRHQCPIRSKAKQLLCPPPSQTPHLSWTHAVHCGCQ